MGYTHYFEQHRPLTKPEWQVIATFAKAMFAYDQSHDKLLANGHGEVDSAPEVTTDTIWFNGIEDASHESMVIDREGNGFQFCKTAQKPYDRYVVALLCYIDAVAPKAFRIASDGLKSDWTEGLALAKLIANGNIVKYTAANTGTATTSINKTTVKIQ